MERTTKPTKPQAAKSTAKSTTKKQGQNQGGGENPSPEKVLEKVLWIKTGGGYFVLGDQTYYPGDKFEADEKEIRDGFRNTIKKVSELSKSELEFWENEKKERPAYMERKPGGKYFVYARGRRINDEPLSRAEAEKLLSEQ